MPLSGTELVAWWGAIVATGLLLLEVYKWRATGARLRLIVQSGMKLKGHPTRDNETLISVCVTNIGDRPTTITTVALRHFLSWWDRFRKKASQNFIIPNPNLNHHTLPHVLEVGKEWIGGITQDSEIEKMIERGHLVVEVYDSVHRRPVVGRVERKAKRRGGPDLGAC